jgi:hypothetical protein
MHHKLTEAKISSLAKNLCSDSMHHKLTEAKISSLAKNLCLDSMHQILKTAEEPSLAKNNAHIHSHININIIGQKGRSGGYTNIIAYCHNKSSVTRTN